MQRHRIIWSTCRLESSQAFWIVLGRFRIVLHCLHLLRSAEQECHLTTDEVDDPHHLDQNPGYMIKDKGAASCGETLKLTFAECEEARLALDSKATAVVNTASASLPTGCYRQQEDQYREQEAVSSYLWFFNTLAGQPDSNSEPICKGNSKRSCLCAHGRSISVRVAYFCCWRFLQCVAHSFIWWCARIVFFVLMFT